MSRGLGRQQRAKAAAANPMLRPTFEITLEYRLPASPNNTARHWTIALPDDAADYTPRQLVEEMASAWLRTVRNEGMRRLVRKPTKSQLERLKSK